MDEKKKDLCRYRLEKAGRCLASAEVLAQSGDYCGAANRSYYSIFHCIRSLLALEGVDFSKHSGVMAYFQKNYEVEEQIQNARFFLEGVTEYVNSM